ncbi:MAG: hypothetical protein MJ183_06560 [Treponemataceae bacterium]|nr:hypothetical protein [Treponemataceae bacterium]
MKKIKILAAAALSLAIIVSLTSCPEAPKEKHVAKVVDLRNKKGGQVAFRSTSPDSGKKFNAGLLDSVPRFIGENGVEENVPSYLIRGKGADAEKLNAVDPEFPAEEIKKAIKIDNHDDGVKFTFTRLEGYETAPFTWINIQYLDGVGHKSTGVSLSGDKLAGDTVELVYPLVDPNSDVPTRFWVQVSTDGDGVPAANAYYASFFYKVDPVNGYGCVDTVQPDYQITDYLGLSEDGVMTLKLTIPPVAKVNVANASTLTHSVGLHMQSGSAPAYSENAGQPSDIWELTFEGPATEKEIEAAENDETVAYTVDFKAEFEKLDADKKAAVRAGLKDKPFIWASLIYHYEVNVPGLEGYVFDTPWVISNVVPNPFSAE